MGYIDTFHFVPLPPKLIPSHKKFDPPSIKMVEPLHQKPCLPHPHTKVEPSLQKVGRGLAFCRGLTFLGVLTFCRGQLFVGGCKGFCGEGDVVNFFVGGGSSFVGDQLFERGQLFEGVNFF